MDTFFSFRPALVDSAYHIEGCASLADSLIIGAVSHNLADGLAVLEKYLAQDERIFVYKQILCKCHFEKRFKEMKR